MKPTIKPALDKLHVSINGGLGGLHQRGRLLRCAAKKVTQFYKLNLIRVDFVQLIQCAVQFQQIVAPNAHPRKVVAQGNMNASAAADQRLIPARMIDQDPAHYLRSEGVEMPPILVRDLFLIKKLEIKFVDQGRRLQHVGVSLASN